ncbi:Glyoxalase/Bleomycin resistance protein/Dihydroxybiphenyl dioxygenase [Dacryopinax primogenitus]|uniref:Glyoxalase/Bleomycin resistance protein/Dihydroxybiphenyl dioxygenase n=1 Tax=Dacryopinax primogenitus (strain DJM 731) TaxID=1858805 RepID=M5G2T7_DACPD|nr:Glyoxalase/Bleomycin resistance protein/Dihydroxybiphenyl dioxygenase [Dacryopinax primogenitus]EJU03009.1 Glyoxalase/Bleomycin resistance protein/Dihydroxybiphenyl dioxygenase [Dacryopinax primogenitus]
MGKYPEHQPGVHVVTKEWAPQPEETAKWRLNHVMLRIRDPGLSLPFYQDGLGMRMVFTFNSGPMTVYYLGYPQHGWSPEETFAKMQQRDGLVELVHVHDTEEESGFKYTNGNEGPQYGFGHIGLTVPDVPVALARLEKFGAKVFKPLGVATNETIPIPEGKVEIVEGYKEVYRQIAMIQDPDGYFIELVPQFMDKQHD